MDSGVSAGEAGGVFAGVIALLAALGKGAKWLFDWKGAREDSERKRLTAWEDSLDRREKAHREEIEAELGALKAEQEEQGRKLFAAVGLQRLLHLALSEVTIELEKHAPDSMAIQHARVLLHPEFRPDMLSPTPTPGELMKLAKELDRRLQE